MQKHTLLFSYINRLSKLMSCDLQSETIMATIRSTVTTAVVAIVSILCSRVRRARRRTSILLQLGCNWQCQDHCRINCKLSSDVSKLTFKITAHARHCQPNTHFIHSAGVGGGGHKGATREARASHEPPTPDNSCFQCACHQNYVSASMVKSLNRNFYLRFRT